MELKILLTVELNGADEVQRNSFEQALTNKRWVKFKHMQSAWQASFRDDVGEEQARATAQEDVASAAAEAGIQTYAAAMQASTALPSIFPS